MINLLIIMRFLNILMIDLLTILGYLDGFILLFVILDYFIY
jgi:hypothetical protein